jgi:CHAT domain-containing protein
LLLSGARSGVEDQRSAAVASQTVGRLTARTIAENWRLDADLVTLSACETALGPYVRGEHFLGFSQAFLLAGSRSVIVSLWPVRDDTTSLLMRRFYQNLLGARSELSAPLPKDESLAEAKRWLRELTALELAELANDVSENWRGTLRRRPATATPQAARPFAHPHYWAPFILIGDPGDHVQVARGEPAIP